MVDRTFTPYEPGEKQYPKLTSDQILQLENIQPSVSSGCRLWPCMVLLSNNQKLDYVCIANAQEYIKYWGAWPEDDPGKTSIDIRDIKKISSSKNRLPKNFVDKLNSAGESGMGFLVYRVLFSDNSDYIFMAGGVVDFIVLPENKSISDIVDVEPLNHDEVSDLQNLNKLDYSNYQWCLFSEPPPVEK